jgi:hypothetical protein
MRGDFECYSLLIVGTYIYVFGQYSQMAEVMRDRGRADVNDGAPRGVFSLTSDSQTSRPSLVFIPTSSAPLIATLTTIPHMDGEGKVQG